MQIYVDGKKVFEVAGDQADTNLNLAANASKLKAAVRAEMAAA